MFSRGLLEEILFGRTTWELLLLSLLAWCCCNYVLIFYGRKWGNLLFQMFYFLVFSWLNWVLHQNNHPSLKLFLICGAKSTTTPLHPTGEFSTSWSENWMTREFVREWGSCDKPPLFPIVDEISVEWAKVSIYMKLYTGDLNCENSPWKFPLCCVESEFMEEIYAKKLKWRRQPIQTNPILF